ncbi:MAG: hypothetical protein ACR2JS_02915 [Candidatus Nanopelagicales bacterium]
MNPSFRVTKRALGAMSALLLLALVPLTSPWSPASAASSNPQKPSATSAPPANTNAAKLNAAQLASTGIVAAGNGTVGVQQVVSVVAPKLHDTVVTVTASLAYLNDTLTITLNSKGQGHTTWTPEAAGPWLLAADSSLGLASSRPTIAAVPTMTEIFVPDKATRFQPMSLTATVTSGAGDALVVGTVTFYEAYLGRLGASEVTTLPGQRGIASFSWTPPAEGSYQFIAKFEPTPDDQSGAEAVSASQSEYSPLKVVTHPTAIQLLMPPVMRIGHPSLVMAVLPTRYTGTVSLVVDGREVSPARQAVNGYTAFSWVPTHTGLTYVTLELIAGELPRSDREVTQTVNVQPQLLPNPISVSPVIAGAAGTPWADQDVLSYPAGSRIDLVSSTGNGAGVNIAQRGACLLSGATLFVPESGGGCLVTFSAVGDGSFAANSAQVLISSAVTPNKSGSKPTS